MKSLREMIDIVEGFSSNDLSDGPYKEGFIQGRTTNNVCEPPSYKDSNDADLYKRGFYHGRKIKRDTEEQDMTEEATPEAVDKINTLFKDKE